MIRVTVSYPREEGARFDHDYYRTSHRQLLLDRLSAFGLERIEIDRGLSDAGGSQPPIIAAAHMIFRDLDGYQKGMTQHGKDIRTDVVRYTDIRPRVVISEVF